jgi:hypothetical protein
VEINERRIIMRFTTRTKVVIINGKPQSGKDTFCQYAQGYCNDDESANTLIISSVDPLKEMLTQLGWDGTKTDEIRDMLMCMKQLWVQNQDGPTMFLFNNIFEFHKACTGEDNIVFVHIREPEEIKKLVNALTGFKSMGIDVISLLVIRKGGEDTQNQPAETRKSDDEALINSYEYDVTINNDEDLIKLQELAAEFVDKLLEVSK